jgi:hypothetical protein
MRRLQAYNFHAGLHGVLHARDATIVSPDRLSPALPRGAIAGIVDFRGNVSNFVVRKILCQ